MILGEKITELRKRSGLSQEQLGDRLGVSRQAVSKWEMSQAMPDIGRILAMSEFFEVPADFLLKDKYDLSALAGHPGLPVMPADSTKRVSLEEVQAYFQDQRRFAEKIVMGIVLFFISPAAGIFLTVTDDFRRGMLGVIIQVMILTAAAVAVIPAVRQMSRYRYFRQPNRELDYGVKSIAEENKRNFEHTHLLGILTGIVLLMTSVIPMMVCAVLTDNPYVFAAGGVGMLLMLAAGVSSIAFVSIINRGYRQIIRMR